MTNNFEIKISFHYKTYCFNFRKTILKLILHAFRVPFTPKHERIKKLEASGIITKYAAVINPVLLGKELTVYCSVTLIKKQEEYFNKFENFVTTLDEVIEIIYLSGTFDYLLKIVVKDMAAFENFLIRKISRLDIISNIQSSFVIHQINKIY